MKAVYCFVLFLFFVTACAGPEENADLSADWDAEVAELQDEVITGAQSLVADRAAPLNGMRVGLIVNHTAMVDTAHLADALHRLPDVEVTALFGPEHGVRGTADAGELIEDDVDPEIGVPIYSLYGETRKPTPAMLQDVDALVFDIQDIGARFYTYISTMGLAMQAAVEEDIPFFVLDRPNPLGGEYISGFVLEPDQTSFVGQFPIPVAHGMTVGELARMVKEEEMMSGLAPLELHVIETEGWRRDMLWPETGLAWVAPSPNIPDLETALVYPGACFFEATSASEGRGTFEPFLLLGAPWADGEGLATTLNEKELPGIRFNSATFTPQSIEGMAASPKLQGEELQGIRHEVTDEENFQPVETGIFVLHAFYEQAREQGVDDFIERPTWLDRLAGTTRLRTQLTEGYSPEDIIASWDDEIGSFEERREPYLLY